LSLLLSCLVLLLGPARADRFGFAVVGDTDADAYPGAEEICDDGIDNDCNGEFDEVECGDETGDAPEDTGQPRCSDDPGDEPEPLSDEGCGCESAAGAPLTRPLLLAVAALRRRRSPGV
jgi:hypothetical protein